MSFHYRYKGLISINISERELFNNYQALLQVGVNQFLQKVIDIHQPGLQTKEQYLAAKKIIKEGIQDVATDIEELFLNHHHGSK